jgi:hypothetical protein
MIWFIKLNVLINYNCVSVKKFAQVVCDKKSKQIVKLL